MLDPTDTAAAAAAGRLAASSDEPITACPWAAQLTPRDRALARAWVGAYLERRPPAAGDVDHDGAEQVDDDPVDDDEEIGRHLPGRHDQKTHGHRYNTPGDKGSGLRKLVDHVEGAAGKAAAAGGRKRTRDGAAKGKAWHDGHTPDEVVSRRRLRTPAAADVDKDPAVRRLEREYRQHPTARNRDRYLREVDKVLEHHAADKAYLAASNLKGDNARAKQDAANADPKVGAALLAYRDAVHDEWTAHGEMPDDTTQVAGDRVRAHVAEHEAVTVEARRGVDVAYDEHVARSYARRRSVRDNPAPGALVDALPPRPDVEHIRKMSKELTAPPSRQEESPESRRLAEQAWAIHAESMVQDTLADQLSARVKFFGSSDRDVAAATDEQRAALEDDNALTGDLIREARTTAGRLRDEYWAASTVRNASRDADKEADRADLVGAVTALKGAIGDPVNKDVAGRQAVADIRKELKLPARTTAKKLANNPATRQEGLTAEQLMTGADKLARMRVVLDSNRRQAAALEEHLAAGGMRQPTVDRLQELHDQADSYIRSNLTEITQLEADLAEGRRRWAELGSAKAAAAAAGDPVDAVTAAISALAAEPGDWVSLTRLRQHLGEKFSRTAVDDALRKLARSPDYNVVPESNQKMLTQADHDAAFFMGAQHKHLIAHVGRG